MPNNMQEHGYLLLNSSIDAVSDQLSCSKKITRLEKKGALLILSRFTQCRSSEL
jgi:hypothetical protein